VNFTTSAGGLILSGTTNSDNLVGTSANDLFVFGAATFGLTGKDTVTGGGGTDTLDFSADQGGAIGTAAFAGTTGVSVLQFDTNQTGALTLTDSAIAALSPAGNLRIIESVNGLAITVSGSSSTSTTTTLALGSKITGSGTFQVDTVAQKITLGDTSSVAGGTAQTISLNNTAGADTITGGAGTENISITGVASVLNDTGGAAQNVTLAGTANASITGGTGAESITAADGAITISAGSGALNFSHTPTATATLVFSGGVAGGTFGYTDAAAAAAVGNTINSSGVVSGETLSINLGNITNKAETLVLGGSKDLVSTGGTASTALIQIGGGGQDSITLLAAHTAADSVNVGASTTWNDSITNFKTNTDKFDFLSGAINHGTTNITTQVTTTAQTTVGASGAEFATNPNSVLFNVANLGGSTKGVTTANLAAGLNGVSAAGNFAVNDHVLILYTSNGNEGLFYYTTSSTTTVATTDLQLVATFSGNNNTVTTTGDIILH